MPGLGPEIPKNARMLNRQMLEHQDTHETLQLSLAKMALAEPVRIVPISM
jgi:hypothetical protein